MTHASLFSGIGGPEVAAQMLGWDNLFHCEINPFGRRVLEYHFPNSVSYEDIKKTDFSQWRGRVDVLTGGFPCQPFSYAGKRAGAEDDRYLWPEMLRAISECQPTWIVGENVAGITTMVEQESVVEVGAEATLFDDMEALQGRTYEERGRFTIDRVCADLEAIGYAVQPILIPACAVGAPHRRDRVFIIAYANNAGNGASDRQSGRAGQTMDGERKDIAFDGISRLGRQRTATHADLQRRNQPEPTTEPSEEERQHCQTNTYGRDSKRTTADTDCERREEPEQSGRRAYSPEEGAGMDDRTERYGCDGSATDTESEQECGHGTDGRIERPQQVQFGRGSSKDYRVGDRWSGFPSVSPVHRGNDGLPFDVHDLTIPFTQWRTESLKAYGNAIVPQVMYEIFRAIEIITKKQ